MIESHLVKIATTGSAGSATGSAVVALPPCELVALHLDYNASAPGATTDVTFTAIGGDQADVTVMTRSNSATDGWFYPKVQKHDSSAAAITGDYADPPIHNNLLIAVAQSNALSPCVTVLVLVRV